jgi:hypothetical protein
MDCRMEGVVAGVYVGGSSGVRGWCRLGGAGLKLVQSVCLQNTKRPTQRVRRPKQQKWTRAARHSAVLREDYIVSQAGSFSCKKIHVFDAQRGGEILVHASYV